MEVSLAFLDTVGKTHTTPHLPPLPPTPSTDFAHEKSVKSLIGKYRRLVKYMQDFFCVYVGLWQPALKYCVWSCTGKAKIPVTPATALN